MDNVAELSTIQRTNSTVFVIDDKKHNLLYIKKIMGAIAKNIQVELFDNALSGFLQAQSCLPDLILANCKMPNIDVIECIKKFRADVLCQDIPIIAITAKNDAENRNAAFYAGAADFLYDPIDFYECTIRCHRLLSMQKRYVAIQNHVLSLEQKNQQATQEIITHQLDGIARLSKAGEYKSNISGVKLERMGKLTRIIADEMHLDKTRMGTLEKVSMLHDIGKLGIPDRILMKDGPLDKAEFEIIKTHPHIGYNILQNSTSPYCQMGSIIALQHHEKFDGSGYPYGLKKEEISIEARIVTVADVFDALLSERPYKKPWPLTEAYQYIEYNSCTYFDPQCVNAFFAQQEVINQTIHASIN